MENSSFSKVRLESTQYSSTKAGCSLTAIFIMGVALCYTIGLHGPTVYDKKDYVLLAETLNSTWFGSISHMEPWHQRLFLQMRTQNPNSTLAATSYVQLEKVTIWGRNEDLNEECKDGCADCDDAESKCVVLVNARENDRTIKCIEGEQWCGWNTILDRPFVQYSSYDMQVDMLQPSVFDGKEIVLEFEIVYIQKEFTQWEMKWFYTFCILTLCFMFIPRIGFFFEMIKIPQSMWSRQQVWVAVLLVALLSFNNMFFVFQVLSPAPQFFFDLYVVQLASFLSLMFFFWLEIFGDMANGEMQGNDPAQLWQRSRRKALREYAPKLVLIFLVWLTTILVYTYVRVQQEGDPSLISVEDLSSFTGVKIFAIVLAVIYFAWLLFDLCKTFRYVRRLMSGYRFVLAITSITVVATVLGMLSGDLAPSELQAWPLTTFSGLYNLYVFTLVWCYTPIANQYIGLGDENSPEMELRGPEVYEAS